MTQKRTFTINLKNDQQLVLDFTPIAATSDRLWQMFATTEALDTLDQIIAVAPATTDSIVNPNPIEKSATKSAIKPATKKKK